MDTKKKKKQKKTQRFLPYTLPGKKLKKSRLSTNKYLPGEEDLEQYLKTGELEYLFDAIKKDNKLLLEAGCGRDLVLEGVLRNNPSHKNYQSDSIYVDPLTIVGEVIRTPQGTVIGYKIDKEVTEKVTKEAKRYLKRISPLLVPDRKAYIEEDTKDGFTHVEPYHMKGGTSFIKYQSAKKFKEYWDSVKDAFKQTQSKKHYSKYDNNLKEEDALKAIKKLGNKLYKDKVQHLDLSNIRTKTASYIRLVHVGLCPICKNKGLSDKTILRLLKKAEAELKKPG